MTIPNMLTMSRIGLSPVLGYIIMQESYAMACGPLHRCGHHRLGEATGIHYTKCKTRLNLLLFICLVFHWIYNQVASATECNCHLHGE